MSARRNLLGLVVACSCMIPAAASAAIVSKWQTPAGVSYDVLDDVGYDFDDGTYKLITGEIVGSTERIAIRLGSTGALVAQTVSSAYLPHSMALLDIDGDSKPEIVFLDASGNMVALKYTTGSSTLAVLWSVAVGTSPQIAWVMLDGHHWYLFAKDPGSNSYKVYDHTGALQTAPLLNGPEGPGWSTRLYVGNYDPNPDAQGVVVAYTLSPATTPTYLCMLQLNTTVGVESGINALPSVELGASYPNPTLSISHIDYSVPSAGQASLRLFDLEGREVRTLVDGQVPAGRHVATWDGRGANGQPVPPGTYFYQLNAAGHAVSQRVVRLK